MFIHVFPVSDKYVKLWFPGLHETTTEMKLF